MRKIPKRPIRDRNDGLTLQRDIQTLSTSEEVVSWLRSNGYIDGVSTDINALVEAHPQLTYAELDLDPNDARIRKLPDGRFEISVNFKHPKTRKAFSLAHEFAHFILHQDQLDSLANGEQVLFRSEESNLIEQQANAFAAEILMPEDEFRKQVRNTEGNVKTIAENFGVSQLAVRYRAKNLGMSGHGV